MQSAANPGKLVLETTIAADNWTRVFLRADTGHVVFKTIIVLNQRPRVFAGSDTNACAPIFVATITFHRRRTTFADADACADVGVAGVADYLRARAVVPDTGIKILETGVPLNQRRRPAHRTDTAAHVAIATISQDSRCDFSPFRSCDANAGVADVVHDVVRHHARVPHLNARRAGRANVFVRLVIALRGMMFLPKRLVITAYTGDRESI